MYDIPLQMALRLLADVARTQQQVLQRLTCEDATVRQAQQLLDQIERLLDEMLDPDQACSLDQELRRLARQAG